MAFVRNLAVRGGGVSLDVLGARFGHVSRASSAVVAQLSKGPIRGVATSHVVHRGHIVLGDAHKMHKLVEMAERAVHHRWLATIRTDSAALTCVNERMTCAIKSGDLPQVRLALTDPRCDLTLAYSLASAEYAEALSCEATEYSEKNSERLERARSILLQIDAAMLTPEKANRHMMEAIEDESIEAIDVCLQSGQCDIFAACQFAEHYYFSKHMYLYDNSHFLELMGVLWGDDPSSDIAANMMLLTAIVQGDVQSVETYLSVFDCNKSAAANFAKKIADASLPGVNRSADMKDNFLTICSLLE